MEKFIYKNALVYVREWESGNLSEQIQRTCFCCHKKINNCSATLLINNYKHIPNTIMHTDCFKQWENKTDDLCDDICSAHDTWKYLDEIFGQP